MNTVNGPFEFKPGNVYDSNSNVYLRFEVKKH